MMRYILQISTVLMLLFILSFGVGAQEANSDDLWDKIVKDWLTDLNQKGLELNGDSLIINKEVIELLQSQSYRDSIYPAIYSWESALHFIQKEQLKPAFWYFINLYPVNQKNRELVLKSILTYDQLFKMDEVLIATFYTYSFLDPEITRLNDGVPEITRPDILERKLTTVKEIIGYIKAYRIKQKTEARNN